MQPRQMRETSRPVRPSLMVFMSRTIAASRPARSGPENQLGARLGHRRAVVAPVEDHVEVVAAGDLERLHVQAGAATGPQIVARLVLEPRGLLGAPGHDLLAGHLW